MDTNQQTLTAVTTLQHPAHLWIGPMHVMRDQVHRDLKNLWCAHNGCNSCITCTQITQHQHHLLLWIEPDKQYTLDRIDQIADTIRYQLEPADSFFFILAHADTLTLACSNRLLKMLEEPPRGYHFILLAERSDMIIPTIRSRCIVHEWHIEDDSSITHQLCNYFTLKKGSNPLEFASFIDANSISEHQSMLVLDIIMAHWASVYKKQLIKGDTPGSKTSISIITHLKDAMLHPPMPGSTKLFWKNLFLQIYG